jgi:plasmid stability protein
VLRALVDEIVVEARLRVRAARAGATTMEAELRADLDAGSRPASCPRTTRA